MSLFNIQSEVNQALGFVRRPEIKRSARKHRRLSDKELVRQEVNYYLSDRQSQS